MYERYHIKNYYATPTHPQTNKQTEAVNKYIKHALKAKLDTQKANWADNLHEVL